MYFHPYTQLVVVVILSSIGQLLLKYGSESFSSVSSLSTVPTLNTHSLSLFGGMVLYIASFTIYIYIIQNIPISIAYPFIGGTYVIVVLGGVVFYNENLGTYKLAGTVIILIGISIIGLGYNS